MISQLFALSSNDGKGMFTILMFDFLPAPMKHFFSFGWLGWGELLAGLASFLFGAMSVNLGSNSNYILTDLFISPLIVSAVQVNL